MYFIKKNDKNKLLVRDINVKTNDTIYMFMDETSFKGASTYKNHVLDIVKSNMKALLKHKVKKARLNDNEYEIIKA